MKQALAYSLLILSMAVLQTACNQSHSSKSPAAVITLDKAAPQSSNVPPNNPTATLAEREAQERKALEIKARESEQTTTVTSRSISCPMPKGPEGPGTEITDATKPEAIPSLVIRYKNGKDAQDLEFRGVNVAPKILVGNFKVNAWFHRFHGAGARAACNLVLTKDDKFSVKGDFFERKKVDDALVLSYQETRFSFSGDDSECTHQRTEDQANHSVTIEFSCNPKADTAVSFEGELYIPAEILRYPSKNADLEAPPDWSQPKASPTH